MAAALDELYPPSLAASWDAIGLVCGDPSSTVRRVLLAVDPVDVVVQEALDLDCQLLLTHHPLFLRPTTSVAADTPKGRVVHRLITAGCGLFVAHTNADAARPGVNDALAALLELQDPQALPGGLGLVGDLPGALSVQALTERVAQVLPATAWGVRASGDPQTVVRRIAVCGGAGDDLLVVAAQAGAQAFLTADLRHHRASEAPEGLVLVDAAHWATEWPWLPDAAARLASVVDVETVVSTTCTDPWTTAQRSPHP